VKVLVSDTLERAAIDRVRAAGHDVVEQTGLAGTELARALDGCQALMIRSATKVTAEVLRGAPSLKLVVRAGTGLDNVDVAEAERRGVVVRNTPAANAVSVAELVFGLLLSLERHLVPAASDLARGMWEKSKYAGREIAGRRLGLLGFGRIGREVARRARAFEMDVAAHDPLLPAWPEGFEWVRRATLDAMLPDVDVLSLHLPLTSDTRGMIGAAQLARMKREAVIVNAARGGIVDEAALAGALASGALRGAAFDVFEREPLPADSPLIGLPNALLTPHLGASTREAQVRAGLEAADIVLETLATLTV
jgi:D-3-phosphoglycerate dehydrogenase